MKIGWYFSPMDWRDPDFRTERNARYVASMQAQVRELLSNYGRIDLLWFDTDGGPALYDQAETYRLVRTLQPQIIINNRLDMGSMAAYHAQQVEQNADYYTPEQRIGGFDNQRPWETCMTLGTQWAWKPDDTIKSLKQCIDILVRVRGRRRKPAAERRPDADRRDRTAPGPAPQGNGPLVGQVRRDDLRHARRSVATGTLGRRHLQRQHRLRSHPPVAGRHGRLDWARR